MAFPTTVPNSANTLVARRSFAVIVPTGGSSATYLLKKVTMSHKNTTLDRKTVINGLIQTDRSVPTERDDVFELTSDEWPAGLLALVLGAAPLGGTCQLIINDPNDATGTAFLMTQVFNCQFSISGNVDFTRDQYSDLVIKCQALQAITWTQAGTP